MTYTNTWMRHQFHILDAYCGNRQNGGADSRITAAAGTTFYLDIVQVSLRLAAAWSVQSCRFMLCPKTL